MLRVIATVSVFIVAVALAASTTLAAQESSPATSPVALPPLLEEWLAAFNAGDPDQLLAIYTDDALWEEVAIGLSAHGQDQIRAHLDNLFAAAPDIAYEATDVFATDDRAVIEWVVTGTYQNDFPGLPPAAGQPFTFRGASVFALMDGKIQRYTEYWDAYGFMVQLGALPAPGTAPGTPVP